MSGTVYCRRCGSLCTADRRECRTCGVYDPGGQRYTAVGVLILATLAASAITAGYAFAVSREWFWERFERRVDMLPDDHALHGNASDVLFVLGVFVFVLSWVLVVAGLFRWAKVR
jgi:RNA polymerase subunit RPABC4/transcription elongation factor Spt4